MLGAPTSGSAGMAPASSLSLGEQKTGRTRMKRIIFMLSGGTTPSGNIWQSCGCPSSAQGCWWVQWQVCPLEGGADVQHLA